MPIDEEAYAKVVEEGIRKQQANIETFMQNIRSLSTVQQDGASDAQKPAPR